MRRAGFAKALSKTACKKYHGLLKTLCNSSLQNEKCPKVFIEDHGRTISLQDNLDLSPLQMALRKRHIFERFFALNCLK